MSPTKKPTHKSLDEFPEEIAREIHRFRDQFGQTVRAPLTRTSPGQPGGSVGGPPAQHVRPHEEGWAVIREGANRASRVLDTKAEAVDVGREIAENQGTQLVIHRQDGSVQETRDYR